MREFSVPLIIRGRIISECEVDYSGRGDGLSFRAPDVKKYLKQLMLDNPVSQRDMYQISLGAIIDFLDAVGRRLDLDTNPYWRQAFEVSCSTSNLSRPVLDTAYRGCSQVLSGDRIRER